MTAISVFILALEIFSQTPARRTSAAWGVSSYPAALDLVFGNAQTIPTLDGNRAAWVGAIRCRPAHDAPEWQVVIIEQEDGRLELRHRMAKTSAVFQQIQDLHEAHPTWTLVQIAKRVRTSEVTLQGGEYQGLLRRAVEGLEASCVGLRPSDVIVSDAASYRYWSLSGAQWLEINVIGGPLGDNPIIRWGEQLHNESMKAQGF